MPFARQKHCISSFFSIVDLIVNLKASQPIEWSLSDPGNRKNNVIFISGTSALLLITNGTAMNGIFCPHHHERTCHLSVSPNWLFTTFQHRQTDRQTDDRHIFHHPQFVFQFDTAVGNKSLHIESFYFLIFLLDELGFSLPISLIEDMLLFDWPLSSSFAWKYCTFYQRLLATGEWHIHNFSNINESLKSLICHLCE